MALFTKQLLFIFLAISLFGCKPEPSPIPDEPTPIVWKTEVENSFGYTSTPFYFNGQIIIGHQSMSGEYKIYAFHEETGDTIWQQTLKEYCASSAFFYHEQTFLYEDKLVFSDESYTYVLNAQTGNIIWSKQKEKMGKNINVIDGYIYKADMGDAGKMQSSLYRYDINTGNEEKLFSITQSKYGKVFFPSLQVPVKWIHKDGNEILILQNRIPGWPSQNKTTIDIFAWNLTSDSMLWYKEGFETNYASNRPAISGNKLYFYINMHVFCIDAETGNTAWKCNAGGLLNTANILLVGNKLIVKPDNELMQAVDKETGKLIWTNKETAYHPFLQTVHNDTVWLCRHFIFAIDVHTGEKLIEWWGDKGGWANPIVHHPTNGYIFTSNGYYMYCLDPKKMIIDE